MKFRKLPPTEYLRECLRYERGTGKLYWKKRPMRHFSSVRIGRAVNTQRAGKEAFTARNKEGRYHSSIDNVLYYANRVIWKLVTGKEPPYYIDHKDRDEGNNRWNNLREATREENFINRTKGWGKSGIIGVRQLKTNGKNWNARIHKDKKYIDLGYFDSCAEAVVARKQAERRLYGEFAP